MSLQKNPFKEQVRVGVLGGGQLGRMMIQSSIDYDLHVAVMDPNPEAPCHTIATEFVTGDFKEYESVYNFGKDKDVLTIEIEHVNTQALKQLKKENVNVHPDPEMLEVIQDKGLQKQLYHDHGIPTSDYVLADNAEQVKDHLNFLPAFQKTRKAGYDGKGVQSLVSEDDLDKAFDVPSLLEKRVDFDKELSVIVARTLAGEVITYPAVEMDFNQDLNLVEYVSSPAQVSQNTERKAEEIAKKVAEDMGIVGLLAVEMFVTGDGDVLVNEVAPRPHNSGHHTIEGNVTSQFEQHLRAILDLPLGDTSVVQSAVMVNLLGAEGHEGLAKYDRIEEAMAITGGVHVHLYGKKNTRPGRKMGHVTVVAYEMETDMARAKAIQENVRVIS